ncbi:hypothetical protein PMIN03_011438 [Paraphaeosphaeria minitans]
MLLQVGTSFPRIGLSSRSVGYSAPRVAVYPLYLHLPTERETFRVSETVLRLLDSHVLGKRVPAFPDIPSLDEVQLTARLQQLSNRTSCCPQCELYEYGTLEGTVVTYASIGDAAYELSLCGTASNAIRIRKQTGLQRSDYHT